MPTTVATDQESTSGLLNPILNSSTSSSTLQASAMVPASALGALLDDVFTGEPANSNSDSGSQIQLTDCVPQGGTVSAKLKLKIWNNEFVDLKLLLPNSTEEPLSIMVKYGKIELQQASTNINPITMDRCFSDIHQHICAKNPSRGKQSVEVHVYHSRNK